MHMTRSELDRLNNQNRPAPVPMKTIRGRLVPSRAVAAADKSIRHGLQQAFKDNGLHELILRDTTWDDSGILFNSSFPVYVGHQYAEEFLNSLNAVMQTETAQKLGLNGYFTVLIDGGKEPTVLRVRVTEGEVSYQQAELVWPAATVMPSSTSNTN
jgi:hypothetical protein